MTRWEKFWGGGASNDSGSGEEREKRRIEKRKYKKSQDPASQKLALNEARVRNGIN